MESLPTEVYSRVFQCYLAAQLKQVMEFRCGRTLTNGKLEHFRAALALKESHLSQWSNAVDEAYCAPIFSNLKDIEELEGELREGYFTEFIVQCCAVADLCLAITPKAESIFTLLDEQGDWLFAESQTLGDIAERYRLLQFEYPSFKLRVTRDAGMLRAVQKIVDCNEPSIKWQEIMMLFRVSDAEDVGHLLLRLGAVIERSAETFPKHALSLLLCYIADGVETGAAHLDEPVCQSVILTLLERGASPMVSWDGFCVLSALLQKTLKLTETPWWLKVDHPMSETGNIHPTTLNRLLSFEWPEEFLRKLRQYACCSLDASGGNKERFGVKMASLRCLAAQKLSRAHLGQLYGSHECIASKHIAMDL